MGDKCSECGAKFVRYPLKDREEKFIWKNLFKMDLMSIIFLFVIFFMVLGYQADIKECEDVQTNPCQFCEDSNCCEVDWSRFETQEIKPIDIDEIKWDIQS